MVIRVPWKYLIPGVLLLLIAGTAFWYFVIYESPETKIRKRLAALVTIVEKKGETSTFAAAGNARTLESFFTLEAVVEIQMPGRKNGIASFRIKELVRLYFIWKNRLPALTIDCADVKVEFPFEDKARAVLTCTGSAEFQDPSGKGNVREVRSVWTELICDTDAGEWLFVRFRAENVIAL